MLKVRQIPQKKMRLWSLSPTYLDRQGLLGLWREGLLAQQVITGNTKGYKHHPQLIRFQNQADPLAAIGAYLDPIAAEAQGRGYNFNEAKIIRTGNIDPIPVTSGQLEYEFNHLLKKLERRDQDRYHTLHGITNPASHPVFYAVPGDIASWEKVSGE